MFGDKRTMNRLLRDWGKKDLPVRKTRAGNVLGDDDFMEEASRRFDRREKEVRSKRMRKHEWKTEPAEDVIRRFETIKGVRVEGINVDTKEGRKLRDELLVMLKDCAGLTYSEIIEYAPFRELKYSSLGQLYKRAKAEESEM
jgi:hypothetical protein